MTLLIDCYNLLHATMPADLAGLDENRLCRLLAGSHWAQGRIVVVCDGQPKPHAPHSPVPEVELRYSGPGQEADDVLIALIHADSAPRKMTVVSSDHAIQRAARRRKARALSSDQFVHRLGRLTQPPRRRDPLKPDPGRLSEEEVDRWLRQMGLDPDQGPKSPKDKPPWPPW